ncbi:hypothetical protein IC757_14105 [Wenzhouxiangella sp. AB-CW3]|uniref:hypothetical protein n=1 Tax=Wenzhouxiangella sp. AB-CW3 TaxID=2771012 RepID=UPI00168AF061|nr:hypothetical protein [Wenzhouxiangella sp. AB-CW3]QOC22140.1 hypothetical protein IC757_14105 [Wenzhouxiangella sp. AB-CW3]
MRNPLSAILPLMLVVPMLAGAQEASSPPSGQQLSHWFNQAAQAYESGDHEAWVEATKHLHRLRPYNQDFMTHLVKGHAQTGDLSAAFDMMLSMQQQGLAEDWDSIEAVAPMRNTRLYDHLRDLMHEAGQPFGDVERWSTVDSEVLMPEALAWDAASERMFLGTVRDGRILVSDDGERWEDFARPDEVAELQAVFDLVVDAERNALWVATGRVPQFQGEAREDGVRSSLLRFDLESGELDAEFPLSSGSGRNLLGNLALAGNGNLYAADTVAPMVYRFENDDDGLQPFFGHQNFTSLRGLAVDDEDRLLYLADYELGIFVVNLDGEEGAWKLAVPETLNEGGIDGLYFWDGHLVAIQNGVSPQRVVRLELGSDGLGVTAVAPIAAAAPEFDTPTFGVMDGQYLYFLAVSHWQYVDGEGNPRGGELPEVPIMQLDVDAASVQVVGQEIMEQMRQQGQ